MKHKILNLFKIKRTIYMSGTIYFKNGTNFDFDTTYIIQRYTTKTIEYLREQKIKTIEEEKNKEVKSIVIKNFIHL